MNRQSGFALILTLWLLAILSLLLTSLTMLSGLDNRGAAYAIQDGESLFLLRGAVRRISAELAPKESLGQNEALAQIRAEKTGRWLVNTQEWTVRQLKPEETVAAVAVGEGWVLCEVSVEDGRLPMSRLNKALLEKLPRMTPVLADQMVAALGLDQAQEAMAKGPGKGPERGAVFAMPAAKPPLPAAPGGKAAAAPQAEGTERALAELTPPEVLLGIDAVSGEVYTGDDKGPGLGTLLTRFSDGLIFVNAAPQEVIQAIPGVDAATAAEIYGRVSKGQPFERVEDLQHVLGVTPAIFESLQGWVKVTPAYYRVTARSLSGKAPRSTRAIVGIQNQEARLVFMEGA